jgi:hypothetical protein
MKGTDIEEMNRQAVEEISYFDNVREAMVNEGLCLPTASVREMVEVVKDEVKYVNSLKSSKRTNRNPRMVRATQLADLTGLGSWLVLNETGPVWFKEIPRWDEEEHRREMAEILDSVDSAWAHAPVDLRSLLGSTVMPEPLSAALINHIVDALLTFEKQGLQAFAETWSQCDWLRGRNVTVRQADATVRGTAFGIDCDGALLVQAATTTTRIISGSILVDGAGSPSS